MRVDSLSPFPAAGAAHRGMSAGECFYPASATEARMDTHSAGRLIAASQSDRVEGWSMKRALLGGAVVAAVLLLAGQKAKAEWLCGENRCVWVSYDVDEPAYALAWGPPVRPSCFWKQGVFGRWKLVCP